MHTCDHFLSSCLNSDGNVFPCCVTHDDTVVFGASKLRNEELRVPQKNAFPWLWAPQLSSESLFLLSSKVKNGVRSTQDIFKLYGLRALSFQAWFYSEESKCLGFFVWLFIFSFPCEILMFYGELQKRMSCPCAPAHFGISHRIKFLAAWPPWIQTFGDIDQTQNRNPCGSKGSQDVIEITWPPSWDNIGDTRELVTNLCLVYNSWPKLLDILQPSHEVFLMDNSDFSLLCLIHPPWLGPTHIFPLCNFYMFKGYYLVAP